MKVANIIFASSVLLGSVFSVPLLTDSTAPSVAAEKVQEQEGEKKEMQKEEMQEEGTEANGDFPPVDDMHHFMEYISKPSYRELKTVLAEEKIRRSAWRKVVQHALILAETTILVAERPPADADDEVVADWKAISKTTYDEAVLLYKAAGEKETEAAKMHYSNMMDACNACHEKYDENNHQLAK